MSWAYVVDVKHFQPISKCVYDENLPKEMLLKNDVYDDGVVDHSHHTSCAYCIAVVAMMIDYR